jgi:hypothetical protein
MTTTIAFPGQPGDPFGDPPVDLTLMSLSDAYLALSQAAIAVDTDEADRVPRLLQIIDTIAFGFPGSSLAARSLSLGIGAICAAAEGASS